MVLEDIRVCAGYMEGVRAILGGNPIVVTSWFRTPHVNDAAGGAAGSAHLYGLAVDFRAEGQDPSVTFKTLRHWHDEKGFPYDQLIQYPTHCHIAFGGRWRGQAFLK